MNERCPTGKIKYYHEKDAWLYAYLIYKNGVYDGKVYICPDCRYYHLTSKKGLIPQWLIDIIKKNNP